MKQTKQAFHTSQAAPVQLTRKLVPQRIRQLILLQRHLAGGPCPAQEPRQRRRRQLPLQLRGLWRLAAQRLALHRRIRQLRRLCGGVRHFRAGQWIGRGARPSPKLISCCLGRWLVSIAGCTWMFLWR